MYTLFVHTPTNNYYPTKHVYTVRTYTN